MKRLIILLVPILLFFTACQKLVTTAIPLNQLTPDKVFSDSSSVVAATVNMYTLLNSADANFIPSVGTYTDELITTTVSAYPAEFTAGALSTGNPNVLTVWQVFYTTIYKANSILEGLKSSSGISQSLKNQCMGEALFIRAYCHYMLANIYGAVPIILTTDIDSTPNESRSSYEQVLFQVIADLNVAEQLLPIAYPASGERVRANKWVAAALWSKTLLMTPDYSGAEAQATSIINSGKYSLQINLNSAFTADNSEAILQLWNSTGSTTLNSVPASGIPSYQVSPSLLSAFEINDQRKVNWVKSTIVSGTTYYYPYKYKQRTATTGVNAEFSMYIRLADIVLTRAEARAKQNNLPGALADLNAIRNRAGLPNSLAVTQQDIIDAIIRERRVELFDEGGNRFFDLKRSKTIDGVIAPLKPLWKSTASLFPIPQSELMTDPNLVQNPGY